MVENRQLPLAVRVFMATYRWRRVHPVPVARRAGSLRESRVALVSTAGLVVPGDPPFDQDVRGGDWSWRVIPADADVQSLEEHHRSAAFDHSGIEADRELAMPIGRLRELAETGEIGAVAPRHASLMGSITAPGRLQRDTLPAIADALVSDRVDIALLVPV